MEIKYRASIFVESDTYFFKKKNRENLCLKCDHVVFFE